MRCSQMAHSQGKSLWVNTVDGRFWEEVENEKDLGGTQ